MVDDPEKCKYVTYLRTEKGRVEKLKEYGYDCLVIWEREIKQPDKVIGRIKDFMAVKQVLND